MYRQQYRLYILMLECKGLIIWHPSTHSKPFIQANRKGERKDFKGPCSTRMHCGGSGHSQDFLYNKKPKLILCVILLDKTFAILICITKNQSLYCVQYYQTKSLQSWSRTSSLYPHLASIIYLLYRFVISVCVHNNEAIKR